MSHSSKTTRETKRRSDEDNLPAGAVIGELAVAMRLARNAIADLLRRGHDPRDLVYPDDGEDGEDGEDGTRWASLIRQLHAIDYFAENAASDLESEYTWDVLRALRDAFPSDSRARHIRQLFEIIEEGRPAPAMPDEEEDAPAHAVRDAAATPTATRPYWKQ